VICNCLVGASRFDNNKDKKCITSANSYTTKENLNTFHRDGLFLCSQFAEICIAESQGEITNVYEASWRGLMVFNRFLKGSVPQKRLRNTRLDGCLGWKYVRPISKLHFDIMVFPGCLQHVINTSQENVCTKHESLTVFVVSRYWRQDSNSNKCKQKIAPDSNAQWSLTRIPFSIGLHVSQSRSPWLQHKQSIIFGSTYLLRLLCSWRPPRWSLRHAGAERQLCGSGPCRVGWRRLCAAAKNK